MNEFIKLVMRILDIIDSKDIFYISKGRSLAFMSDKSPNPISATKTTISKELLEYIAFPEYPYNPNKYEWIQLMETSGSKSTPT